MWLILIDDYLSGIKGLQCDAVIEFRLLWLRVTFKPLKLTKELSLFKVWPGVSYLFDCLFNNGDGDTNDFDLFANTQDEWWPPRFTCQNLVVSESLPLYDLFVVTFRQDIIRKVTLKYRSLRLIIRVFKSSIFDCFSSLFSCSPNMHSYLLFNSFFRNDGTWAFNHIK